MNFKQLTDLPVYDLQSEFLKLIESNQIGWFEQKNKNVINDQICINTVKGKEDDIHYGRGSLIYDWDKFYHDQHGKLIAPYKDIVAKEEDFTILNSQFKGTLFEEVYATLEKKYVLGRVRIMNSKPKTCLSWHTDGSPRLHYPIKTQEGCLMIIEDEVKHLPENTWWWTNTTVKHTAINASKDTRIHLVVAVLEDK